MGLWAGETFPLSDLRLEMQGDNPRLPAHKGIFCGSSAPKGEKLRSHPPTHGCPEETLWATSWALPRGDYLLGDPFPDVLFASRTSFSSDNSMCRKTMHSQAFTLWLCCLSKVPVFVVQKRNIIKKQIPLYELVLSEPTVFMAAQRKIIKWISF